MTTLVVGSLVGTLVGGLVVMDRMALAMIRPPRKRPRKTTRHLPFESLPHAFSSFGQDLSGWVVEPEVDDGRAAVVLAHGWGSTYGKMIPLANALLQGGHPVFLFDIRHHGESPPASYVTARHFRDDIGAAAREMKVLFPDRPLALVGHSMGGSTGILAANHGAPFQGLVTIGSPADLWEIWARHLQERGLPGRLIIRLLWPFWRRRAGVPLRCLQPEKEAGELQIPLLVIHGDRDESVTVDHAHVLAAASGTEAFIMEGGDHNRVLEKPVLHERLLSFLEILPG